MAKLTQEELDEVKKLQQFYNQLVFEIGKNEAQLITLQKQINFLLGEKDKYVKDLKTLEDKESQLAKDLQAKYGQGKIDIETGEIAPVQ
jgi:hypothetical protein